MAAYVCPWWLGYTFDHRLRNLVHNPVALFGSYVTPGMTVLDIGCGLGFTTIGMAELAGNRGRVIALDIQQKMLTGTMRRAKRVGLEDRIRPVLARQDDLRLNEKVDFALAFYMVHEVPDPSRFMRQVISCLSPGARFMIVEPKFHVSKKSFEKNVILLESPGLILEKRPKVHFSRAALFRRPE